MERQYLESISDLIRYLTVLEEILLVFAKVLNEATDHSISYFLNTLELYGDELY